MKKLFKYRAVLEKQPNCSYIHVVLVGYCFKKGCEGWGDGGYESKINESVCVCSIRKV